MVVAVAKYQRADVHALLPLAHDGVPHRGGVAGALDAVPGQLGQLVGRDDAGLHELALGGDLTRGRVDEERGHRPPMLARAAWGRRAAPLRPRAAAPRRRGAHPPRLRRRLRRARGAGRPRSGCAGRGRLPRLRRCAARVSRRRAPRTLARKLASARAFFRVLVEHGELRADPADLLARRAARCRPLKAHEVAALLDRIPATTPLELRDRAMFELAYGCGLRAEELVKLDLGVDFDASSCACSARAPRASSRRGAVRAVARYLEHGRGRWRATPACPRCSSPRPAGGCRRSDIRRRLRGAGRRPSPATRLEEPIGVP